MVNMQMEELEAIQNAAKIEGFLPYLNEALDTMSEQLKGRIYSALNKSELTPEQALMAWQEMLVIHKMKRRFNQKVQFGQTVAEQHAAELNNLKE